MNSEEIKLYGKKNELRSRKMAYPSINSNQIYLPRSENIETLAVLTINAHIDRAADKSKYQPTINGVTAVFGCN